MQTREAIPWDSPSSRESLEQHVRVLQERLAFYEGFDLLIQDNVAHARELFRLAAQERQAASSATDRVRRDAGQREAYLRAELESIAGEVGDLTEALAHLSRRIARALGEPVDADGRFVPVDSVAGNPIAVVVHGVPSARTALSLQRYLGSLPQVTGVSAREFVGGVLRLDVRASERLQIEQLLDWKDARRIQPLTERPEVLELALEEV